MNIKAHTYLLDEDYYSLIDKLAIKVEAKINNSLEDIIKKYMSYLEDNKIEELRSPSEYGLELLYIGVLYISYLKDHGSPVFKRLEGLCVFLESTKEFDEIVLRFKMWLAYFMKEESISEDLLKILEITKEFLQVSESKLGKYTMQVPDFIEKAKVIYKDRNDLVFVTRHRNEYYINMVGAQILNNVFHDEFKLAYKVFVFAPGCMAAQLDKCKAEARESLHTCSKCTDTCPINLTGQVSEKYNARTVIVYHNSELYNAKVPPVEAKVGVVGIACVLNLISGGLKAKELGYVPQCVLLNYCGCKQHWDFHGLVTDVNRKRLEQVLIDRMKKKLH